MKKVALFLTAISLPAAAAFAQDAGGLDLKDDNALAPDVSLDDRDVFKKPTPDLPAVDPKKTAGPADPNDISSNPLEGLTAAQQDKLRQLVAEAGSYVTGIRIQEAMERLNEAEEIAPDLFVIHNLRGAAYTKVRDFEKARASFTKALQLKPGLFHARFNLAEIDFVEHKWADAEKNFNDLLKENSGTAAGTVKLIQYKIMICKLRQGDAAGAKAMQAKFDPFDDEPVYYFANAAVAYEQSNEEDAKDWLRSAENIYKKEQLDIYLDAMIEVGWVDSL